MPPAKQPPAKQPPAKQPPAKQASGKQVPAKGFPAKRSSATDYANLAITGDIAALFSLTDREETEWDVLAYKWLRVA